MRRSVIDVHRAIWEEPEIALPLEVCFVATALCVMNFGWDWNAIRRQKIGASNPLTVLAQWVRPSDQVGCPVHDSKTFLMNSIALPVKTSFGVNLSTLNPSMAA
jgi:hypothetical protein